MVDIGPAERVLLLQVEELDSKVTEMAGFKK